MTTTKITFHNIMATSSNLLNAVSSLVLLAFIVSHTAIAQPTALSCNTVEQYLLPCVTYVLNGGRLTSACCNGIRSLYSAAKTTSDKQAACVCLKQAVQNIPFTGRVGALAAGLPAKCNVNLPYKISPSTDCKSVK